MRSPTHGFVKRHAREPIEELFIGHARRVLRGHVSVDVVEADAVVEGEAGDPPLVLGEYAEVVGAVELEIRRRPLKDAPRRPVPERVLDVAVREKEVVGDEMFELEAGLHRVGAGDVGHRRALHVAVRVVRMTAVGRRGAVAQAEPRIRDRDGVRLHAWLPERVPLRNGRADAGFEQQAARQRRAVGALHEPVRLESIPAARLPAECADEVDPQLQACWLSLMMLNLCLGCACQVSRPGRCRTIPTCRSSGPADDRSRAST